MSTSRKKHDQLIKIAAQMRHENEFANSFAIIEHTWAGNYEWSEARGGVMMSRAYTKFTLPMKKARATVICHNVHTKFKLFDKRGPI